MTVPIQLRAVKMNNGENILSRRIVSIRTSMKFEGFFVSGDEILRVINIPSGPPFNRRGD